VASLNDYIIYYGMASQIDYFGLHCEHLPASISYFGYIERGQPNSMTIPAGNGATSASGTGPASGYSLKLLCFILFLVKFVLNLNTCTCYFSLTTVMEILLFYMLNFGTTICPKLSISLTIKKPDIVDKLSVANFAATIKPNVLDGSNNKCLV